jgi:hypothetical protein
MEVAKESLGTQRRFPRICQELPLSFRQLDPEKKEKWVSTRTKMLGGGGFSVISPVLLPLGTLLHAKISHYAREIEFTAEIVWAEEILIGEEIQAKCGLRFTQISQESLLLIHDIINNAQNRTTPKFQLNQ